jgi:multiple sugar transport system ATP-binding protein
VGENIGFPLKVRKVNPAEMDVAIREAAAQVELDQLLHRYPRELSGGQRQRVALARAIIRRPSVFLMDEPLSNLDAKLRGHMRAELKHMQQTLGITTIYVTHDQIEAMTLAHRVAILEKGVLQQLATPSEIYNNPANLFVAQFIGSPPMNIVKGTLDGTNFMSNGEKIAVPVKGEIANAILGVRPEDCSITTSAKGALKAEVYTTELIGDHTLVTTKIGGDILTVKASKDYSANSGDKIGISFDKSRLYVFDADGGARVR